MCEFVAHGQGLESISAVAGPVVVRSVFVAAAFFVFSDVSGDYWHFNSWQLLLHITTLSSSAPSVAQTFNLVLV
jgi:hypothetical protein